MTVLLRVRRLKFDEDLEETAERIREVHGDRFSYLQYRIWARLVKTDMFKDISVVPPIPALQGTPQPRECTMNHLKM